MRKSGFSIALIVLTLAIGIGGASWIFANGIKRPVNNLPEIADFGHQELPKVEEPAAPVFDFPAEPVTAPRPQPITAEDQASSIPKPEPAPPKEQPRRPGPTPTTPKNRPPETEPTSNEELRKALELLEQLSGKTVEFTLTVSGVVVDEFGAPASGAEVFARLEQKNPADAGGSGRPARRIDLGSMVDKQSGVAVATADQAGRFTATFTRRVGEETTITVCLKALGENWLEDGETRHEARSGDNLAGLTLKVKTAATLGGRVVDGSGIGIEMASVFLTRVASNTPPDHSRRVDDLRRRISSSSLLNLRASTDAGGNFVIKGVPEGEYAVNVTRAGFQQTGDQRPQVTVTSGQSVTLPTPIVLSQSATVRVSVSVDDGTKLTTLRGDFMKEASGHQKAYSISLTASADKDGTFSFPHLPAGNYTVIFSRDNRMYKPSDPIPLVVKDGQATDLGVVNIYKDPDAKPYPKRGPGPGRSGDYGGGGGGGEKEAPEAG